MQYTRVLDNVYHLEDNMGVCMTLITGRERALLIDTGYGLDSLPETVRDITSLPLTVVLTHGHHDHALGAAQFSETRMCREDMEEFRLRTAGPQREKVAAQACGKGIPIPDDFFLRTIPEPNDLPLDEQWGGFQAHTEDLGDLKVLLIRVPGHTPGSICVYVDTLRLLLTGDDWNPCTWLWFPTSTGIVTWRRNMTSLFKSTPFNHVLCSHQPKLFPREKAENFLRAMNDEILENAEINFMGADNNIDTRQVTTEDGQILVFDYQKYLKENGKMKKINVQNGNKVPFHNNASYCVGTGRMGLALQREYYEQLKMAQEIAGFRFIRGHGLFCDDMGICKIWKDWDGNVHEGWNFTYLDRVMDMYLEVGIRPFLELGFMPNQLASGTQTIFYWKGNTTPPKDESKWTEMIRVTLRHLADRYGEEEVSSWPCEVWNEPNLPGFWEHADKDKYLRLYEITVKAVKETLPDMKVGGPAVCGGPTSMDWIRDFLTFCRDRNLPMDFLTRHAYMGNDPQHKARYMYHTMREIDTLMEEMTASREILDSFPEFKGKDMYITEFNTSYNPFCPIHDTNLNAAYTAGLLARLGDVAAGYSYWTFGDVFEEGGVPARPFHGGFGMIANGLIAKPTLWTFAFFNKLKGDCVYRDENAVITCRKDGSYEGILWNLCRDGRQDLELEITLPGDGEWSVVTRVTDEENCNPLKIWHEMGEPESLRKDQTDILRQAGTPLIRSQRVNADGKLTFKVILGANGVTHFLAEKSTVQSEEGYEYDWYLQHS